MTRTNKVYLHIKTGEINDLMNFFKIYEKSIMNKISEKDLEITFPENFDFNDFLKTREIIIEELYIDFTAFVVPKSFNIDINKFLEFLPEISPGIYSIEKIIPEIIIANNTKLKQALRSYYYNLVNHETINTVLGFIEANMNASSASKKLYMHRNTLNYRLDHFIDKTEINVRDFPGALAVYLLFRR